MEESTKKTWWRWGTNRWIVLGLMIVGFIVVGRFAPVLPTIQLPAEHLTQGPLFSLPVIGDVYLTNTLVATGLAYLIILALAFAFRQAVKKGGLVLSGLPGALEALLEFLYNMTESTAGKRARTIFQWFGAISLLVLVVNWMELIPGVDSIGFLEKAESGGVPIQQLGGGWATIVKPAAGEVVQEGYVLVPFVRVVSTDLNFTAALAVIAVIAVQVVGVQSQGIKYFTKYWNTKTLFNKPIFGVIDFGVGLLELISEISKILSFAFRLFGNIFAGSVLLFVMQFLLGKLSLFPTIFLMLEFFVGAIQAVVFGLLTMTFMAQATQGHGEHQDV